MRNQVGLEVACLNEIGPELAVDCVREELRKWRVDESGEKKKKKEPKDSPSASETWKDKNLGGMTVVDDTVHLLWLLRFVWEELRWSIRELHQLLQHL